jgi:MGT family glycosyltransferase
MARFLFTVWPFSGHIHPNLAVAQALRERGHEVAFYTGRQAQPLIECEGFRCFPFQHVDGEHVEKMVRTLDSMSLRISNPLKVKALFNDWFLGTVPDQLADLEKILDEWRTDVIVCDLAMWGPILILHETRRIPVAVFSYVAACILPGPEGPIVGLPMRRPRTWLGRLGVRSLRALMGLLTRGVRRAANQLRESYGLPPISVTVTEFAGRMPAYLVPSAPEYDRERKDLPPSVYYVGPCHWNGSAPSPRPDWLDELGRDQPVVYVTEGTMHNKESLLLPTAISGLANLPVQVVMTTGRHREPSQIVDGGLPAHVRIEQWIDHGDLFPLVDVVVTTGGSGTVLAALQHEIPLVIVPTAWDQPENAWRVHENGAGLRLAPHECTPEQLGAAVQRVLSEPSFRLNAERLASVFARYGGSAQAADVLEGLAASSARGSVSETERVYH